MKKGKQEMKAETGSSESKANKICGSNKHKQ
jgi:hypothetical protein